MTRSTNANSTVRHEITVGRANTPEFSWPTVLLALGCLAGFAASVALAMTGTMSYLLAGAINTVIIYAIYTVLHEAVHMNISAMRKDLQWVDRLLGSLAGVLLWQFYDHHRADHLVHHRITNHDDDPDISARAGFMDYVFIRLPVVLLNYFNPVLLYRRCRELEMSRAATRRTMTGFAINTALAIGVIAMGYGFELVTLWLVPWYIGNSLMLLMFTWSPHHDHQETGRYRNTRIIEMPAGNALLLGQGYHLIHHMMPGIPWYRYKKTFEDLRPTLEENDVRIEGVMPNPAPRAASPAE
ncbi:Fatty acid desaturase [Salinihabitans flavidus]|uniref:Fatty acid desaturase n=1 Tax=Salinihabitans flavidus TaxID=569882 RepID=A0A1H8MRW8_9RHOB|nr:fatty acid desaturase [Salinihabitans flavidus]SEO20087.1 Fatty acid desaturase [Salinihabitans flavidus]